MKIYIIIFIISVVSFIAYLAIRDYKAMKFNNNMQEGQRCCIYVFDLRIDGIIQTIDESTGRVLVIDKDMVPYYKDKSEVYPPFNNFFIFEK